MLPFHKCFWGTYYEWGIVLGAGNTEKNSCLIHPGWRHSNKLYKLVKHRVYQEVICDQKRVIMEMKHDILTEFPKEPSYLSKDLKEVTWRAMWLSGIKASRSRGRPVQRPWGGVMPVCWRSHEAAYLCGTKQVRRLALDGGVLEAMVRMLWVNEEPLGGLWQRSALIWLKRVCQGMREWGPKPTDLLGVYHPGASDVEA